MKTAGNKTVKRFRSPNNAVFATINHLRAATIASPILKNGTEIAARREIFMSMDVEQSFMLFFAKTVDVSKRER